MAYFHEMVICGHSTAESVALNHIRQVPQVLCLYFMQMHSYLVAFTLYVPDILLGIQYHISILANIEYQCKY